MSVAKRRDQTLAVISDMQVFSSEIYIHFFFLEEKIHCHLHATIIAKDIALTVDPFNRGLRGNLRFYDTPETLSVVSKEATFDFSFSMN